MKRYKRIVFIGDLLRNYEPPRTKSPADGFIKHIYYMFSEQIKNITDLEVVYEINNAPKIFDRMKFFELCNKKCTTTDWVNIYDGVPNPKAVEYFRNCFFDSILIFQEAGALRKYADAAGIIYIDMFISSIRFTEDLNYAFRSNIETIRTKLLEYRIPEISFYAQANLIKSYYNLRKKIKIEPHSCVLCGQTSIDLSVIKNGKLYTLLDFLPQIKELGKKHSVIYYLAHPNADPNSEIERTLQKLSYIKKVNYNIYQLLANENIDTVAALSSSVLQEAKYFHKNTYILLHPYVKYYNGYGEFTKDMYVTVNHECFSTYFWKKILGELIETKECEYFNFENNSNFLRKLIKGYYGYRADDFIEMLNSNVSIKKENEILDSLKKLQDNIFYLKNNKFTKKIFNFLNINYARLLYLMTKKKKYLVSIINISNRISLLNMKSGKSDYSNITVVLQGSTLQKFNGIKCVEWSVCSIRKLMPHCKIILSTWKGEDIPKNLLVDKVIYNEDPGFYTRDCTADGKKNNVNRQIVSTYAGLKEVKTPYALKLRTDFILTNLNFVQELNKFRKYNTDYRIFERRILCSMFDTRKPYGEYYNLPYHIGDLFFFGLTSDLLKLFDIPLVTKNEFTWFIDHTEIKPDTFAKNKYNAEQSIWMGCLRRQGKKVYCEYSTHINDLIAKESDLFLANNFVPYSFKGFGALPLKKGLRAENRYLTYCDNYTLSEWKRLYNKCCDANNNEKIPDDKELKFIKFASSVRKSRLPDLVKSFIYYMLKNRAKKIFD